MQYGAADKVIITTIVDNYSDLLLPGSENVRRAVPSAVPGTENQRLLAEHGLSLLVEVFSTEGTHCLLLDAGLGNLAVPHNLADLQVDQTRIEKIVLSHGHFDHFGSLVDLLRRHPTPLILHPHAFSRREVRPPNGPPRKMPTLAEEDLRRTGAELVITPSPVPLAPGTLTTGEVARTTSFELGLAVAYRLAGDEWEHDNILDDQGVVINLRDKGLVVISGCAHAGIVNTVRHAQQVIGVDRVHAVMGGFHLSGVSEEVLDETIAALLALDPAVIVPMHCTGWQAVRRLAEVFPDRFVINAVGTSITL